MALPYLIKYVYNNGVEEVIRRGKKIHVTGNVELIEHDVLMGSIVFRVKDDSYSTYYKVYITNFKDEKKISLRCTCPYNLSEICRHKAAAMFQLQEMLDRNLLGEKDMAYNQKHTVVKMKLLELKMLRLLSSTEAFNEAEEYLRSNKANIIEAKDERVLAEVDYKGKVWKVIISKNEERNFDTSCDDETETEHPLCVQKIIVFLQLLNSYGPNYFDSIRNWDAVKNKLLAMYGYSLNDDLTGKFEFTYQDGRPFLRVLDNSIKRVVASTTSNELRLKPVMAETVAAAELQPTETVIEVPKKSLLKLGIVILTNNNQYPYIQFESVQGEANDAFEKYIGKVEKLDLNKFINTEPYSEDDKILLQQLRKLLPNEITKYLNRNSPFSGFWENIIQQHDDELPEETRKLINEYLHPKIKKILAELSESNFAFYLPDKKSFTTANLQKAEFIAEPAVPEFYVNYANAKYEIECKVKASFNTFNIADNECASPLLFQHGNRFYTWDRTEDIFLIEQFLPTGKKEVAAEEWTNRLHDFILPLTKEYNVNFGNLRKEEVKDIVPEMKVLLREKGEYLIFQPVFNYKGYDVKLADKEKIIVPLADKLLVIQRNIDAEKELVKKIENLHSSFIRPVDSDTLALKGADVLRNNWFFLFVDAVKDMNVNVYGYDALKNFRFNTAKPSTKIFISSHTDWFDAKIEIQFGEQKVTIADVKKALANKQQFVQLQDGTLGILPEEWIRKYSLLFKVGEGKANNMKLSKFQFSVIEDLYNQRDEEELFIKLEEKYERLKGFEGIKKVELPQHLQPILRPYQESGFQWLNYLREVQWGGILADDMGLGKTVQALAFLNHLKEENKQLKALVVCPTTLMFNWQNEVKKFTPTLNVYVHHGGTRDHENIIKKENEIIITTYGTLRSDIKEFVDVEFDYVVLDESQAIKNKLYSPNILLLPHLKRSITLLTMKMVCRVL